MKLKLNVENVKRRNLRAHTLNFNPLLWIVFYLQKARYFFHLYYIVNLTMLETLLKNQFISNYLQPFPKI